MKQVNKAPVEVIMPEVRLAVADLAYMTGLLPGATRCYGAKRSVTDKLVFLGLIEMGTVAPCAKTLAGLATQREEWKNKVRQAVRDGKWRLVDSMPYNLREENAPKASMEYVLTDSGRALMSRGRATSVTSIKAGCVK